MAIPAARISTITKLLLADAVHDRLLAGVVTGAFAAGERLNVDQLAESFGVSRTPVREALARLAQARLVEISRNSSTVVADWGVADMRARARLLGCITQSVVLDPSTRLVSSSIDVHPVTPETIGSAFVAACERIADQADTPLPARAVRELAAPLELFLDPEVASTYAVDLETDASLDALTRLGDAMSARDRGAIAGAVEAVSDLLIEALHLGDIIDA